jgi:hypothetical protein
VVLPGEAFCDECGAPLGSAAPPAASADAPTMMTTPATPPTLGAGPICPQCGRENMAGDRFCDNCGAALPQAQTNGAAAQAAAPSSVDTTAPTSEAVPVEVAPPTDATVAGVPTDVGQAPSALEPPPVDPANIPTVSPEETGQAPAAPNIDGQATYDAERTRLEGEIARQTQVVTQLEAVQQTLGAATPPGVLQSLDDARAALARTQAELDALTGGAALSTAPAVTADAPTTPAPEAASTAQDMPAAPAPEPAPAPAPVVAPAPEPAPAPAPVSTGPRLVFEDSGAEITLPTDRREIIIGREDPISGIHPEVDMTPHGGESGGVSRQHARLTQDGGQWSITDLNSTNYTRVDGVKLDPNVATPVHDGARIQLGRVAMVFRI